MDKNIPKKSLGQHWLFDDYVLQNIADLAQINPGERVVEIGPGLGTLTAKLLKAGADVVAVEFDNALAKQLDDKKLSANLQVINQDILRFNFEQQPEKYKIVANIPYYLTSNLIRILTETNNQPDIVVLLIQKEVAQRICAAPGQMSMLSVWAQLNFDCSLGPVVDAEQFTPPPKVDSQVVVMKKLTEPIFKEENKESLQRVIKAGFASKRKTILNCLSAGLQKPKTEVAQILNTLSINQNTRAQELNLETWLTLSKNI